MKNDGYLAAILYTYLSDSALKNAITGKIYKSIRPKGSAKEDVVCNAITVNGDQFQLGTANVNIYVKDLTERINGVEQTLPNTARIDQLSNQAIEILNEFYSQQYAFWFDGCTTIEEAETGHHYANIRINFKLLL